MPEIGNSAVWKQADADNTTGTQPSWSGSANPNTIDNAGRAMMGAITREWNWRNFTVTSGGSSTAYTLTYSVAPAALYNGQRFAFKTDRANAGSDTLNINTLGAKTIKKDVSGVLADLDANDWGAGQFVEVAYNSGSDVFVWVNRIGGDILGSANTFTANQTIKSTDAGASVGPLLTLYRDSASPAALDEIGAVNFDGKDSGGNQTTFASIGGQIDVTTDTGEFGSIYLRAISSGSQKTVAEFYGYGYAFIANDGSTYPWWDFWNTTSDANAGRVSFTKARGSSVVQASDILGQVQFYGYDGAAAVLAGYIRGIVDGTPGSNDMPGGIILATTADGASTPTQRLKIAQNGFTTISNGAFGRGVPVTKTGDFTVGDAENWIIVNKASACTVTLPAASSWPGREITIKTITANAVSSASSNVVPWDSATAGTVIIPSSDDGGFVTLVSDGTNWIIMMCNQLV